MSKLKDLQNILLKRGIDRIVLFNEENPNPNLVYLTGYNGYGFLIVDNKETYLYVPSMEFEKAKKEAEVKVKLAKKKVSDILKKGKIGFDFKNSSAYALEEIKKKTKADIVDISESFEEMREVKDEEEINKIAKACEIGDRIFERFVLNFREFNTENEAKAFLVKETIEEGCTVAFPPIVASGKNASIPHYEQGSEIKKGFCIVDFGVKYKGYCSDMTRTIYYGEPSGKEIKIYENLLEIQERVLEIIKEGVIAKNIDQFVRKRIGKKFIHSLGHGIGIEAHEKPWLSMKSNGELKENIVITIEPGVYEKGKYGIRIEDAAVVKKGKAERLTRFRKELIIIN